jgi:diacylglycerol O-acyltransferase
MAGVIEGKDTNASGTMERPRELGFERRMSDQEALMWNIEKDPWMNPNGAAITVLDRPADLDALLARLRYGLSKIPRLRERVVPGLGRLSPPVWATDQEFDLDYHVRHLQLPAPGTMRQLLDTVTKLYEEPYDRTRPLWMFYVIDGLEGGKGVLFSKQHHAVADGVGALRMAELYTDLKRRVPKPPEVDLDEVFRQAVAAEQGELLEAGADMSDSILDTAQRTISHNLRRQGGIVNRFVGEVTGAVSDPSKLIGAVGGAVGSLRSTVDSAGGGRTVDGGAPLWTHRSRKRHLEIMRVSVDDAKTAAKALGGTINDFFVAGAAIGAFEYHVSRNTPADAINMTFVVSTRRDKKLGGNSFTPVPVQVPAAGDHTPAERFEQLRDLMAARRESVSGSGAMSAIAGVANLLPTSVTTRLARQQAAKIDIATSNLRGAPITTYIAGGKVEMGIPMGPIAGTAANLTTISQNGWMDMGLFIDPVAIADPAGLRQHIEHAYAQLIAAATA